MAHTSKIFDSQPVRVQNVNGFDLSHITTGTAITGKLTPVLNRLVMQQTKVSIGCAVNVELPPLATAFFGRIDANIELFFTPCSLLYGGFKQFISAQVASMFPTTQDTIYDAGGFALPVFDLNTTAIFDRIRALNATNRGLSDYLDVYVGANRPASSGAYISMLAYLNYHRIWDTWYRNASVTKTIFAVNPLASGSPSPDPGASSTFHKNVSLIWHSFFTDSQVLNSFNQRELSSSAVFDTLADLTFPDGIDLFSMRQRNYPRDYFTAASVNPQQGNPAAVRSFVVTDPDTEESYVELSIPALRMSNSLQKFYEAANYDPTYKGIMRVHFGHNPKDAEMDEPMYLGRVSFPVYQKSVYQSVDTGDVSGSNKNPFAAGGALGAKAAHGEFSGEGSLVSNFTCGSFGFITALFSLVPHAMYSQGISRQMTMTKLGDFPFPELQSTGMDSIKTRELMFDYDAGVAGADWDLDFAYIPRYSFMKYIDDSCHGELRPNKTLSSFVLQRVFPTNSVPAFGTAFCEIPENALDDVLSTSVDLSNFTCWYEIYWVFKAVMPLAEFCLPTLGELQDTHEIRVSQGGSRL